MRILLASSSSGSRGGGEIFLKYLGRGLAELGHELVFWCARHSRMDELADCLARIGPVVRSDYRNCYDYRTRGLATCLNDADVLRIVTEWAGLRPDLVHVNKQNLEDGLDLLRAANAIPVPGLCTIHITQSARFLGARMAWLRDAIARRVLRNFNGPLVAVQETRREELSVFLDQSHPTRTILNGVPPPVGNHEQLRAATRKALRLDFEDLLILGVGRMVAQKRPLLFLETAAAIHQQSAVTKFLWVGDGDLAPEWDAWVERRRMTSIIRRCGWQNDVSSFLCAADLFLHAAAFEGLPFALLEAMSWELPCAVPRTLAVEIGVTGEDVLFIEDVPQLLQVLATPVALKERGDRARRLAESHFSIERMALNYQTLYRELCALRQ